MLRSAALVLAVVLLPHGLLAAETKSGGKAAQANASESHHEGYYYPKLTSREVYKSRARALPQMDRRSRLLFMSALTKDQTGSGYSPRYAVFAKGDDAEKMIIVGLDDSSFSTIYRARAVMAAMSSLARVSPMLKDADLDDILTFYDIARMLGFKEITVSDGRQFAHRITLQ